MEGFVFDLQRFAVYTVTSDLVNDDGFLYYSNDAVSRTDTSGIKIAKISDGTIIVEKDTQLKFEFAEADVNKDYTICAVPEGSLEAGTNKQGSVIIYGPGVTTSAGAGVRIIFNGDYGGYPVVADLNANYFHKDGFTI